MHAAWCTDGSCCASLCYGLNAHATGSVGLRVTTGALSQMYERAKLASHVGKPIPPPVAPGGNQWVKRLLKMPESMVTGTIDDDLALAMGTFSDEVRCFVSEEWCAGIAKCMQLSALVVVAS